MWFQWDILLLETGFLAILVAPTNGNSWFYPKPRDHVTMMMVRWLLFRMMFASGVVKLQSNCPTWWGLTAMPLHYESQCIPTYLSWFAYNVPSVTLHKLSVIMTFITEIPMTLMFYHPTRFMRKMSFFLQIQLMIAIMLTGNYNFFNFLYIALCFSLLDDAGLGGKKQPFKVLNVILNFLTAVFLISGLALAFYHPDQGLTVVPTKSQFDNMVTVGASVGLALGALSLILAFFTATMKIFFPTDAVSRLSIRTLPSLLSLVMHSALALVLFLISVPVFLRGIGKQSLIVKEPRLNDLMPTVQVLMDATRQLNIVHSYGLFRSMTGVGGRPEIVIEGADSASGPWTEYNFLYKPGNVSKAPLPFVLPHQPRVDWQMWFAALGTYERNPWLISLVYRLLKGEDAVLKLIDQVPPQFKSNPPKVIRISLYLYHFTGQTNGKPSSTKWWFRDNKSEYLPPVTAGQLEDILIRYGIMQDAKRNRKNSPNLVSQTLKRLRDFHSNFKPHFIVQQTMLSMVLVPWLF